MSERSEAEQGDETKETGEESRREEGRETKA